MAQRQRTTAQWRALVQGWAPSGLTQAEYCQRHGISVSSFHRWRERLQRAHGGEPAPAAPATEPTPARLLPVHLSDALSTTTPEPSALTLVLPNGLRLQISPGCRGELLREVLELLPVGA